MVRPETIMVMDAGSAPLTGIVDGIRFAGDRQRIIVRDVTLKPLVLDVPNTLRVNIGDRIGLSIAPEAIRLLPPESR
jgi:putative spermidine/putrescine transport system ATP-binding protein